MDAIEFNRRRFAAGDLSLSVITELVEFYQEAHEELLTDGKCGDKTLRHIAAARAPEVTLPAISMLAEEIIDVALGELGEGEERWNNSGPAIAKYRSEFTSKDFRPDQHLYGEWCAYFVGWCAEKAAQNLGTKLPFEPHGGAKRTVRRIGKAGTFIARAGKILTPPAPGDFFSFDRGARGSAAGHVGIILRYEGGGVAETIEGNVGRFPCKVRKFQRDFNRSRLEDIARL